MKNKNILFKIRLIGYSKYEYHVNKNIELYSYLLTIK